MKLYNTLTKKIDNFSPLSPGEVHIYSCGPTVYDHIHIGNLSAFVASDTLRRVLIASDYKTKHVMNITDVDDKTIRRSQEKYSDLSPEEALKTLTEEYSEIFLQDIKSIGNNITDIDFIKATDNIDQMRKLISQLYKAGFAYVSGDGIYFSIEKYKKSGKTYGQLLKLTSSNTSNGRIENDEYDKESIHDFALWKARKEDEPAWDFELDGHNLIGRPGWHIECSAMSYERFGIPFDIHTGGVDLIFPHHENEIAQSTATQDNPVYAKYFIHNEHLLVDGKKMSKSLDNFYTLRDIQEKGYNPLAFRLLVLQSNYQSQSNFSWESLDASTIFLKRIYSWADLIFQPLVHTSKQNTDDIYDDILGHLQNNLDTPNALAVLSKYIDQSATGGINPDTMSVFLQKLDKLFGLKLSERTDISDDIKHLINQRQDAKDKTDWEKSDNLRQQLHLQGIGIRDSESGQIWFRI